MKKVLASQQLAKWVAKFADEMKAQDIVVLDMRHLVNFCDYFVITTGTSDRQVKAIAQGIEERLEKKGIARQLHHNHHALNGLEYSQENGMWILLDMGDVVAHIFEPQAREFYGLEHLWQDAVKIEYQTLRKTK